MAVIDLTTFTKEPIYYENNPSWQKLKECRVLSSALDELKEQTRDEELRFSEVIFQKTQVRKTQVQDGLVELEKACETIMKKLRALYVRCKLIEEVLNPAIDALIQFSSILVIRKIDVEYLIDLMKKRVFLGHILVAPTPHGIEAVDMLQRQQNLKLSAAE